MPSGIPSMFTAVSGMQAAQAGLFTVGHNMANSGITGYVRQRVNQSDIFSYSAGTNANGKLQVGLGTNITSIQQLRNEFLDNIYRKEVSKLSYHEVRMETGKEIESAMQEMDADYSFKNALEDVWDSLNQLSIYQPGLETRGNFLNMCEKFLSKATDIYDLMLSYQQSLNEQVKDAVDRVNYLVGEIDRYNTLISSNEVTGDHANDYRDSRNNFLDELSTILDITYSEKDGVVSVMAGGNQLLGKGMMNKMGLKYISPDNSLVEPVFTPADHILRWDEKDYADGEYFNPVFSYTKPVNDTIGNDNGKLLGLIVSRGMMPGNYLKRDVAPSLTDVNSDGTPKYPGGRDNTAYQLDVRSYFSNEYCLIPGVMRDLDTVVHEVVTIINDTLAPALADGTKDFDSAPYDLNGVQSFTEVFKRKNMDRFSSDGNEGMLNAENPDDYGSLYTLGNIVINPLLIDSYGDGEGLNLLPLSDSNDYEDNEVIINKIMDMWSSKRIVMHGSTDKLTIYEAYAQFVGNLASDTQESESVYLAQEVTVNKASNERMQVSSVSMDEETTNMLKYQYAYNSAARILNVIDSMLDRIINQTGRAGL